jgi:hypothetical protein
MELNGFVMTAVLAVLCVLYLMRRRSRLSQED